MVMYPPPSAASPFSLTFRSALTGGASSWLAVPTLLASTTIRSPQESRRAPLCSALGPAYTPCSSFSPFLESKINLCHWGAAPRSSGTLGHLTPLQIPAVPLALEQDPAPDLDQTAEMQGPLDVCWVLDLAAGPLSFQGAELQFPHLVTPRLQGALDLHQAWAPTWRQPAREMVYIAPGICTHPLTFIPGHQPHPLETAWLAQVYTPCHTSHALTPVHSCVRPRQDMDQ